MGLLDGDIEELFGEVFGEVVFLDATLHRIVKTAATDGDLSSVPGSVPCKAHFAEVTDAMREAGFTEKEVAICILKSGIAPDVTTDDEITLKGDRFKIAGPIISDPAASYWIVKGQPA